MPGGDGNRAAPPSGGALALDLASGGRAGVALRPRLGGANLGTALHALGRAGRAVWALIELLLAPPQCPLCNVRLDQAGALCPRCMRRLAREQSRLRAVGNRGELQVGATRLRYRAIGIYKGAWARWVRTYKQDPHRDVAAPIERLLVERARAWFADRVRGREGEWAIVPAPMAAVRRRERGQNPPERLALALGEALGLEVFPNGFKRVRYRGPLQGRSRKERRAMMEGAVLPGSDAPALVGRRLILIDDVLTTGSTLIACAQAAIGLGARPAAAAVLARTRRRGRRCRGSKACDRFRARLFCSTAFRDPASPDTAWRDRPGPGRGEQGR
ncbi:MAG: ComF family protein [Candidatus Eisenbacteria bacterium]|nr:ComF family protein [Candidatus Eisenbacteria bacterium]